MAGLTNRIAKLEAVHGGDNHPRFLIVHGARSRDEAMVVLGERGVSVRQNDMIDWQPGSDLPAVEVVPMSMPFEDALALLDAQHHDPASLKAIKGNQDAYAR